MARSEEIQYVRFYSAGSAATQLELPEKKVPQPVHKPKQRTEHPRVLVLDRMAVVGIVVAVMALVLMVVGVIRTCQLNAQLQQLEQQVDQLQARNEDLTAEYRQGYDLEEIRIAAGSMGMVPGDQVKHITISVPRPVREETVPLWQRFVDQFLSFLA